jgi:hypothetical protein
MFGILAKEIRTPSRRDHPEMDTSAVLNDDEHRKFQMLIGILNWIVSIGRFDVARNILTSTIHVLSRKDIWIEALQDFFSRTGTIDHRCRFAGSIFE